MTLAAVGLLAMFVSAQQCSCANLLSNGGFENGGGPQIGHCRNRSRGCRARLISAAELVDSADIGLKASTRRRRIGFVAQTVRGQFRHVTWIRTKR